MPRAKIPYKDIDAEIARRYPFPNYQSVSRRDRTPQVVYQRANGLYRPFGWKIQVSGFAFSGIYNLEPKWEYFHHTICIIV